MPISWVMHLLDAMAMACSALPRDFGDDTSQHYFHTNWEQISRRPPLETRWMVPARAQLIMTGSGSAEKRPDVTACNTFGWTRVASTNRRALSSRGHRLPHHISTLDTVSKLGILCKSQGKLDNA